MYLYYTADYVLICTFIVDDALRSLAEEFWLWKLNEYPEWATAYGWHQFDRMLESYDYSKFDSRWVSVQPPPPPLEHPFI